MLDPQFNGSIWRTVVGIIEDVRRSVVSAEPSLDAYVSTIQAPTSGALRCDWGIPGNLQIL
jgi:hypothetical protein